MSVTDINRKLHIHLGLALLLFIWLFSLSGLILNHGNWKFTSFWEERRETKTSFAIAVPAATGPDLASDVLKLLKIEGEVQEVKYNQDSLDFKVIIPGLVRDIHLDLNSGVGVQKIQGFNVWGKLRTLHTFNGIDKNDHGQYPSWLAAITWRFTMDGIALGLIIICVSSWIMWLKVRKTYKYGYLILFSGFAIAGYFMFW